MCLEKSCIVPHGAAQGSLLDVLSLLVVCDFLVHGPQIAGSRLIISANLAQVGFPRFDSTKTGHSQDACLTIVFLGDTIAIRYRGSFQWYEHFFWGLFRFTSCITLR